MGSGGGSLSTDAVLVEQLQWLQAWVTEVASQDVDMQCQQLASACQNLQGSLATKALEALEKDSSGNQTGQDLNVLPIMQSPALLMGAFQAGSVSISSL